MTTPSHTVITRESARHAIVGATILVAHAVVFYGLLSLGPKLQSQTERPVEVRFIAEAPLRQRSEPPQVKVVTPAITAPVPELPVLESPVMPASEHAISVPVQTPVVARTAPVDGDAPKLISSVEYLREPLPRYPPQSRKLREQGLVVLRVLIDEKGMACSIEVETSSGHERLDHAAREAVARAAFRPYVEDGLPRRALVLIPIEFSLTRSAA